MTPCDRSYENLLGFVVPSVRLPSTRGLPIDLGALPAYTALFVHPFALPGYASPAWASAWTTEAQTCARQLLELKSCYARFRQLDIDIFGVSPQSVVVQQLVAETFDLPFSLLSDPKNSVARTLDFPMHRTGRRQRPKSVLLLVARARILMILSVTESPHRSCEQLISFVEQRRFRIAADQR